jgi:aminoglycoside phosphotransferase (APT) family kinase protein
MAICPAYRRKMLDLVSLRAMETEGLDERLGPVVGRALGRLVAVEELARLPGGASKDTWRFVARDEGGNTERMILRAERAGPGGAGLAVEGALLAGAARAGVPVPPVIVDGSDSSEIGARFLVLGFVDGETIPRRILREDHLKTARTLLTRQCGRILAAIHRIPIEEVPGLSGGDPLAQMRSQLAALGQPHPAFELGLLWLSEHRPSSTGTVVVHGDFRNGNLIVGPEGIRAVLDWELAHIGDPIEDLGWLCVKAWRFGAPSPVGGFGPVDELVSAYEAAGGPAVEPETLRWWVVYGTLRWGIICIFQTLTHLRGAVRSVELAAIGRRVCEVESDLLDLLPWGRDAVDPSAEPTVDTAVTRPGLHDVPSAGELLEAVRGYLEDDVLAATEGRVRFHARVAANVVAMVAREIALGGQAAAHAERLGSLGVHSEAELAEAIRSGRLGRRLEEVGRVVRSTVADKLAVANPSYPTGDGSFSP